MINRILFSKLNPVALNFKSTKIMKYFDPEFITDSFEKKLEYLGDIVFQKKLFGIKGVKQSAKLYKVAPKDSSYESYFLTANGKKILGELEIYIYKDEIHIEHLEAKEKHKGIGSKLLQIAVERCIQKTSEKRVKLNAQGLHLIQFSPIPFYEKMGFERTGLEGTFGVEMVLHPLLYSKWVNKLNNSPIILNRKNLVN